MCFAAAVCGACGGSHAAPPPEDARWWRGKTAYEVYVRSFADSNGDGIGDLRGLTAKLDVLNDGDPATTTDLGVDAIWLMPISPSPSDHGYDVTDHRGVNPQYGTLEDFDTLVREAHRRGIKVLLDLVLNHTSDRHPWFVNAQVAPAGLYRDWYVWSSTDPRWHKPWDPADPWVPWNGSFYYALFCPCMPDLNYRNPAVEQEMTDVMRLWLSRGADGFRLDGARYYVESPQGDVADQPETHALLRRLHAAFPKALLVGEVWTNENTVASYGNGDELQLAFSFDLAGSITSSLRAGDATELINTLAVSERVLTVDRNFEAPFLSNHDQERVFRALKGDVPSMRLAAATLFAMPGTPFIYYGEELGMRGGSWRDDSAKRTAYRFSPDAPAYGFGTAPPRIAADELPGVDLASQQKDPASLWNLYRSLIALRHARAALATGDATRPEVTGGGPGIVAVLRRAGASSVLFVANYASVAAAPFSVAVTGSPSELLSSGLSSSPSPAAGQLSFPALPPRSYAFYSL